VPTEIRSVLVPLSFEENQGQAKEQARYLARGQGYTLFLTPRSAVLGLRSEGTGNPTDWLRLNLQGSVSIPAITGEEELPGQSHYFVGNDPAQWRTHIPTYARVRYHQVYPGVDLVYYGRQGRLENDFEVAAGANPKVIRWQLEGAEGIRINPTGDLLLTVGGNEVCLQKPRAYQINGAQQRDIPVRYEVHDQKVSFTLGKYDQQQKLIIDPVLTYSSFLGGTGGDLAYGVAVDSAGEAYVTGVTASVNFPTTSGVYQSTNAGSGDVFVTKFNASGSGVLFSTYLGGTGTDIPAQILLDATGNIYITGSTNSLNFPTTSGVFQPTYGGNQDAFLTKLKPTGSALVYSTYIGGSGVDFGTALALDSAGDAFVTGSTQSTNFPTMNPLQLGNAGLSDAFATEIDPSGALKYSTYLGGSQADYGTGIAVDSSGNVYICGYTYSGDFPTQSPLQSSLAGGSDVFITKFKPGSNALIFSTYLGGSSIDRAFSMIVDSAGNIFVTGDTQSKNFPVTASAFQSAILGTANAFLTKVAPDASLLVYSTIFGGSGTDQATAMATDSAGNVYLTGYTQSGNFPLIDPFQNILGISGAGTCGSTNLVNVSPQAVCADAFVAKFGPSGTPVYSSFLGGSGTESGQGIAVDSSGAVYVVGNTASANFPATSGVYQWLYQGSGGGYNAFITKISPQDAPSIALTPQQITFGNQPLGSLSNPTTVTLTNEGSAALNVTSIASSGDFKQTNTCGTSLPGGGATCTIQVTFAPTSLGLQTSELTINDNAGSGSQSITVTGDGVLTGGSLLVSPSSLTFPAQTVNTTSTTQSVLLINNGNQAVTITDIVATGFFAQTNTCGNFPTTPATLNVGQACTISVTFSPSNTGSFTGNIQITSNAVNSASVSLAGTGTPVFTLSSNARSSVVLIGSKTATFTISAAAPSTFLGSITLSCSGGATCSFNPTSISGGQSSTLTVTGLSASTANPLNFTVTGTSTVQTGTISLSVFFADYTVTATPSGTTVTAGNKATYTITATPTNGFNQVVLLSCSGIPQDTTCYFNPPALTLSGTGTASSTLTITTTAQSSLFRLRPPRGIPPGYRGWKLLITLLTLLIAIGAGLSRTGLWRHPQVRLALLFAALVLVALGAGCQNYVNPININPVVTGTPSGTFNIAITGTLGNNNGVTRTTFITMSVQPGS
jgi:hypothetical protein